MRGGTSRGPFFLESDLPADIAARDATLLAVMGSPDVRQIDGLGGADPLTSKVGIVRRGQTAGVDLEFLFAQVSVKEARVDTTPNCGNMLAAVAPFGLETGLIRPTGDVTTLRVLTRNTGTLSDIEVQTPGGQVQYSGSARIDGVPGTAAPIKISFLETAGSVCGSLLPTGRLVDRFDGIEVTCIDNGMPVVLMPAEALGVSGYETRDALNANTALKQKIESIRLQGRARHEFGRCDPKGRAENVSGGQAGRGWAYFDPHLHSARLPFGRRRAGRGDRRDRRGAAGQCGAIATRGCLRATRRRSRWSIPAANSAWF